MSSLYPIGRLFLFSVSVTTNPLVFASRFLSLNVTDLERRAPWRTGETDGLLGVTSKRYSISHILLP
jgi:hypothetical protein